MVEHDQKLANLEVENCALVSQVAFLMKNRVSIHYGEILSRNAWALKAERKRQRSTKNRDSHSESSSPDDGSCYFSEVN